MFIMITITIYTLDSRRADLLWGHCAFYRETRMKRKLLFGTMGVLFFGVVLATIYHFKDEIDSGSVAAMVGDSSAVASSIVGSTGKSAEKGKFAGKKFRGVQVVDKDYLMVHFKDGDVIFVDTAQGECPYGKCDKSANNRVVSYGEPLNTAEAVLPSNWHISSTDDTAYGASGREPVAGYRKSKMNGMAQMDWAGSDFAYKHTMEHWIYLQLPSSLVPGKKYTIKISPRTKTDVQSWTFTYDIFESRSEAIHVNLSGYHPRSAVHAADLYIWMGNGGARDYSSFEGNRVYLYNVASKKSQDVGKVSFWKKSSGEAQGYNFTKSNVWNVDFTGTYEPGVYRLAVDGVGASQDFIIGEDALLEPFRVSTLGYFYMRIGQDSLDITPVPRRPLWIPGKDPKDCKVVVTNLDPYHPDWAGGGDRWDQPGFFAKYVKRGAPENPNAKGGHSDALDWDRHLGHVSNIYDMLLPFILTRGAIGRDDLGIAESGNGAPDIIDEAKNEVDFWLSLRFEGGYSHGLSNPDEKSHVLYQADNTAIAAWANATNTAMLAEAYRIAGKTKLMKQYLTASKEAWNYASGLSDPMLDKSQEVGNSSLLGRDFRMTAAAWLYNLTGETIYENIIAEESLVKNESSAFYTLERNQLYAMAAYLQTERKVNFVELQSKMRAAVVHQAKEKEAKYSGIRPSRRSTDDTLGYFHTSQFVHRSILAHAVATNAADRKYFERALTLEADWGLGRNPANVIQMTTATTKLGSKRSIESCYTSGRNDGTPGMHPGHTPYLNIDDWDSSMVMGRPSWMLDKCYPGNAASSWPRGELYFNTRFVWAHGEFTPKQTMRGKMALYGYLLGMKR